MADAPSPNRCAINAKLRQRLAAGELAFLRIRYKLPGQDESRLIERPITRRDFVANITAAPESARFATAVAGYGQLLRGDAYLDRGYSWDDVINLAQGARGRGRVRLAG